MSTKTRGPAAEISRYNDSVTDPKFLNKEIMFLIDHSKHWGNEDLLGRRANIILGIAVCPAIQSFINPETELRLIELLELVPEGRIDFHDVQELVLGAWIESEE